MLIIILFYILTIGSFLLYSYFLIDPNITFFNHPIWSWFLERVLQLGYHNRQLSWQIYFVLVFLLFIFNYLFIKNYKKISPIKLALLIAVLLLFSYPFLSHDFLKYMFDAKILTLYHKNPYLTPPVDLSFDRWLRFMQWIEQPFRYGPVFLLIAIVPSFLAWGKFSLSFIFFKITFAIFYLLAVYFLNKMNRRWAVIFATNPLILIDGLINSHNDIIAVSLLIIGLYLLFKKKILSRVFLFLSVGIKYLTLPSLFLSSNKKSVINKFIFVSFIILPFSLLNKQVGDFFMAEIHTWYFIVLLGFLPFYEEIITRLNIFFFGLLMCYYPFIRLGNWISFNNLSVKHLIILSFSIINLLFFLVVPKWRTALLDFIKLK